MADKKKVDNLRLFGLHHGEAEAVALYFQETEEIGLMNYKGKKIPKRSEMGKIKSGKSSIPMSDHITFSVDDIEATTTELKGKGVVFDLEPMQVEGGIKVTFILYISNNRR